MTQRKPIIATFLQLEFALRSLHLWRKAEVDRLHDVWLKGAPTPNSRLLAPKGYDPRVAQPGNYEARIVLPTALETWVEDVCKRRGITHRPGEAHSLVERMGRILAGDVRESMRRE